MFKLKPKKYEKLKSLFREYHHDHFFGCGSVSVLPSEREQLRVLFKNEHKVSLLLDEYRDLLHFAAEDAFEKHFEVSDFVVEVNMNPVLLKQSTYSKLRAIYLHYNAFKLRAEERIEPEPSEIREVRALAVTPTKKDRLEQVYRAFLQKVPREPFETQFQEVAENALGLSSKKYETVHYIFEKYNGHFLFDGRSAGLYNSEKKKLKAVFKSEKKTTQLLTEYANLLKFREGDSFENHFYHKENAL